MLARCGLPTRLSAARPRTELAGAARSIRCSQGRRDPGAPTRGRRAPPTQSSPGLDLGRPRDPQRAEQTAAHAAAPATARLTQKPPAPARPPRRPQMDLPAATPRPATRSASDTDPGATDGEGEPDLGLPPHPRG